MQLLGRGAVVLAATAAVAAAGPFSAQETHAFLKQYCVTCHSTRLKTAGVALDALPGSDSATWEKVLRKVRTGEMPPPGMPRPPEATAKALVDWVGTELDRVALAHPDPGRVPPHRLNRAEYNNAVRDLFGVNFRPGDAFPADDSGYGFDNVAGVLSMPPLLAEKYLAAAARVSHAAVASGRVFTCRPEEPAREEACAAEVLSRVAWRAWRRPVTAEETRGLMRFYRMGRADGGSFDAGVELGLKAILVSPRFLFRVEPGPKGVQPDAVYALGDFELASRLSFFLWSSLPDEALLTLAQRGALRRPETLRAEARRMLRDPRAHALTENFAGQWLELRNLASLKPDPDLFPQFAALREPMRREAEMFFDAVVKEDRSVLDFLDAPFTFLNGTLAKFYGIAGVEGRQFRRVQLTDERRGGVLTMGAVLAVTSYPTRTSPVVRGKWVLENLLGAPPPPPPANVPSLETSGVGKSVSLRQQMEQHRADPSCAVCHVKMDPIGFSLENYDAIGHWRERDGGFDIDASGKLPSGAAFRNAVELKKLLREQPSEFLLCFTEKLATYALGRGMDPADKPWLRSVVRGAADDDYRFSSFVLRIVDSVPFRMRRKEGAGADK